MLHTSSKEILHPTFNWSSSRVVLYIFLFLLSSKLKTADPWPSLNWVYSGPLFKSHTSYILLHVRFSLVLSLSKILRGLEMYPQNVTLPLIFQPGAGQQPAGSAGDEETESSCQHHPATWTHFVSVVASDVPNFTSVPWARVMSCASSFSLYVPVTKKLGQCLWSVSWWRWTSLS